VGQTNLKTADDHGGVGSCGRQTGRAQALLQKHKLKLYEISAVTGKGAKYAMADEVQVPRAELKEAVGELIAARPSIFLRNFVKYSIH
jgi:hypothetical protein